MIRYLHADELAREPQLAHSMFLDRACQFKTRLGWDVDVNAAGEERDVYDDENPIYVIWQNANGRHGGSMRFLPTVGRCMVNDHFRHLMGDGTVQSPVIWECTRFCLSRGAGGHVAAALMLAGGEILQNFGLEHFVGVFDARMERIYRRIGASPTILGSHGEGRDKISVGLWEFSAEVQSRVANCAQIPPVQSRHWFDQAFGMQMPLAKTA